MDAGNVNPALTLRETTMQRSVGRQVVWNGIHAYVRALLFVLFTPFIVCLSAANDDTTTFTIPGGDTIELTWNEILRSPAGINTRERASVMLCNMSNQPTTQPITITLIGFNFRSYFYELAFPPPTEGQVLKTSPEVAQPIGPQSCVRIPISANPGNDYTPPDPGKYSGFLVVAVGGVPKVKKSMVIMVPPVAPVEADVTFVVSRLTPWDRQATIDIPLNLGTTGAKTFEKAATLPNYKNWPIGRLATTEASVAVFLRPDALKESVDRIIKDEMERTRFMSSADSAPTTPSHLELELLPPPQGVLDLPVTIQGIKRVGTYSGTLTLANSTIPLKIRVTDGPFFPIIAIASGVLLGFLIPSWVGRYRHQTILKARIEEVAEDYNRGSTKFREKYEKTDYPWRFYNLSPEVVKIFLSDVNAELRTYARHNWLFNTSSDEFKKLDQRLDSAASDARVLGEVEGDGLGPSLAGLQATWMSAPPADDSHLSTLDGKAHDLLTGRLQGFGLKVGDAHKLKAQADMYAQALKKWRELNLLLRRYEDWSLAILNVVKDSRDVRTARHTRAKILALRRQFNQSPDLASLEALGSSDMWTRIYEQLAYLSQAVGVPEPGEKRGAVQRQLSAMVETFMLAHQGRGRRASRILGWLRGGLRTHWVWLGDVGVAALSLAIAILAALNQYYFGKTFGTLTDYLTVFLLGTGIQLTARSLVDLITQLRSVRLV